MYRKALEKLIIWKNKTHRKPLMVTGIRQCGKTYLIREFGKQYFDNTAYLNFDGNTKLKSVFENDFDTRRIVEEIESIILETKIMVGKTLVVFDEIQDCPRAIQSLKYFCEEMPELHIIAAGSLLGVALRKEGISFPVGKIERLEMFPMSFEEFVEACGGKKYIEATKKQEKNQPLTDLYTEPLTKFLKNYYIVGGMPEAVQTWVETHDFKAVEEIQDNILSDYADDFGKHSSSDTATKIRLIWDSIPVQIAKDNDKFVFSHAKAGARAKDLEDALQWLVNAGIVYKLNMVTNPELPLSSMADISFFKVYMSDVGLLRRKSNINYRTILEGDNSFIHYKGALTENYVLSQLKCMGIDSWFWKSKTDAELDFITDYNGVITPIEVKSADNTKAKSLHLFCNRYEPKKAIKSSLKNISCFKDSKTEVYNLPLYCIYLLKDLIENQ